MASLAGSGTGSEGVWHFLAALPGRAGVVAIGDPIEEVLFRVLGVEGDDESAGLGSALELDADARARSGGDGLVGLQGRGNIGRLAPCHAIVVGGHVAGTIAFRVG